MLVLQSVIIPKKYYTLKQAEKWIKDNNYKISYYNKKVDITENYYRFRQASPTHFKNNKYITKKLNNNIMLILGELKNKK